MADATDLTELAKALRDSVDADIWYDASTFEDDTAAEKIADAQSAMVRAADLLERLAQIFD